MADNITVAILQHRLLHYRVELFERLKVRLEQAGVRLVLVHGEPAPSERVRRDTGTIAWSTPVRNRWFELFGKELLWQPLPPQARGAALLVMIQENRVVSNYALLLRRMFGARQALLGFWGHGRNYQSRAPGGARERWKSFWLRRVDWWFTYTGGTKRHIVVQGFDADRVTVLENAIDGEGFRADLAAVTATELDRTRAELGIVPGAAVAIYCGTLYADKRIDVLLDAADLLRERLPGFHLLVVGDGPEAACVREAAARRPWLHVLGIQKGHEKARAFRLAQLMLNPGLVGLHVVDAFVAKTPIVTQRSAMHSPEFDYLLDGVNGVVVDGDDAQRYADAAATLLLDRDRLCAMQQRCAEDAGHYTLDNMVERFADGVLACLAWGGALPGAAAPAPAGVRRGPVST